MKTKGFTLLELLITIGIISILSGITIVAINPTKQFAAANDAKRFSDVNTILSAVGQYTIKHRGALPTDPTDPTNGQLTNDYRFIDNDLTGSGIDLCTALVGGDYLNLFPIDPSLTGDFKDCANPYKTGYQIKYKNSHVSVRAPYAQGEDDITVTY